MKRLLLCSAIAILQTAPSLASASSGGFSHPTRFGLSIGTLRAGGAAITADTGPIISDNITLGGEIFGLSLISLRGLLWERPESLSGFVGGLKLFVGFKPALIVQPAGEFGWMHRFKSKVDAGIGAELVLGEYIGGTLKISVGYLLR